MSIAVMKQALAYIEEVDYGPYDSGPIVSALRAAIEQAEKPVAWMYDFLNSDNRDEVIRDWMTQDYADITRERGFNVRPLYTAPRQWVGLTRDEAMEIINSFVGQDWAYAVDAIEAKLKEKNT
jgi:hypothetical protein